MLPVKRFTDFAERNNLFTSSGKILAAVSGGIDSVLMVHLLKAAGYNFSIAHCNFNLRGAEAERDEQFTKNLAEQLDVQYHNISYNTLQHAVDNKISIQMAARDLRYQWFYQLAQQHNYNAIALAHHQNDTIETILLNLTRGTGIAGMHGILPKNGLLVRPLMFLTRTEIEIIVAQEGLPYVEDSSNSSVKYARNKLRHQVMPVLKELNPALEATFENNLQHFRELEQLLNERVEELRTRLLTHYDDEVRISKGDIEALSPKRLLLTKLLEPYGVSRNVVDDLLGALNSQSGKTFIGTHYKLILDRDVVIIAPDKSNMQPVQIEKDLHDVIYNNYKLTILHDDSPLIIKDNPLSVSVDAAKLVYPLTIRSWQQGDQFFPLGMNTRQKLSDFFIHQKLPLHKKNDVPVLVNGNGDIIWLGGYRLDNRYKVTDNTKKVTIFELYKL